MEFQPTRPLRGATVRASCGERSGADFNPRAPCGARRQMTKSIMQDKRISTHAPLAGRDEVLHFRPSHSPFQPTRPLRGATRLLLLPTGTKRFQPTRPLRGATACRRPSLTSRWNFNPRAPCGARPSGAGDAKHRTSYFNPRAPCGARLATGWRAGSRHKISTHAPLAGRDWLAADRRRAVLHFNPRAPCGARRPIK